MYHVLNHYYGKVNCSYFRSIRDVSAPITKELEDESEMRKLKEQNDYLDDVLNDTHRSKELEGKYEDRESTGEIVSISFVYSTHLW